MSFLVAYCDRNNTCNGNGDCNLAGQCDCDDDVYEDDCSFDLRGEKVIGG